VGRLVISDDPYSYAGRSVSFGQDPPSQTGQGVGARLKCSPLVLQVGGWVSR